MRRLANRIVEWLFPALREWRIGATAMRIISLAESHGSRFREGLR